MENLFDRHRGLLEDALKALDARGFWSPYPEAPSGRIYGETARADADAAFASLCQSVFLLPGHPQTGTAGKEVSPFGPVLSISYPTADVKTLIAASKAAAQGWAQTSPQSRVGLCLEVLARLNRMSFLMANAVMHTTGQAFAMAFQAGGPHAQDRGLEAVATAYREMTRTPQSAIWEKPQGKAPSIVMEKHWRIVPRGISLVIGCNTFPTWNSYPGLFASLATGNTVIAKPHPGAILPVALTVRVIREVLAEQGFDPNVVLLAADEAGVEITTDLARTPDVAIIDYTGSNAFADWLRTHAGHARLYTEEAGVNSIVISATDDFACMCANIAFSLSLYSGQMCTSPQDIFVPAAGIETNEGHKSFDDVANGIATAIDALLSDPARAANICGTIANPATLARVEKARVLGRVVRDSAPAGDGRCASPLLVAVDADETKAHESECFGPIAFIVKVKNANAGIAAASRLAREKGAITAALYETDEARILAAAEAFAQAGVNLSVNLIGGIFVNQSAAFSDFHVTGANPAGNASLTDAAFVVERFRTVMWRRLKTA